MQKAAAYIRKALRQRYSATWGVDWPEDDAYLSELWFEAKADEGISRVSKHVPAEVWDRTLIAMRETHEF